MKDFKSNIFHLGHSSFLVETQNTLLIFDYYNDDPVLQERSIENGVLSPQDFKTNKDIFVFVSHSHSDHYNPVIFQWQKTNPNIKYVLSSDVREFVDEPCFYYMNPYEVLEIKDIKIKTYGSTDKGVSFLIDVDGLRLFHAGDLNWWHWKSFSDKELKREEEDYKREVGKIIERDIDIAFIPVDPRLGEFFYLGGEYFVNMIKPKLLVPMHFRNNFYICREFANKIEDQSIQIANLTNIGQKITF